MQDEELLARKTAGECQADPRAALRTASTILMPHERTQSWVSGSLAARHWETTYCLDSWLVNGTVRGGLGNPNRPGCMAEKTRGLGVRPVPKEGCRHSRGAQGPDNDKQGYTWEPGWRLEVCGPGRANINNAREPKGLIGPGVGPGPR